MNQYNNHITQRLITEALFSFATLFYILSTSSYSLLQHFFIFCQQVPLFPIHPFYESLIFLKDKESRYSMHEHLLYSLFIRLNQAINTTITNTLIIPICLT